MDFICNGVPSSKVWEKYVNFREKCTKKYGWKEYALSMEFDEKAGDIEKFSKDIYMQTFLSNICLRPSCYAYKFKTVQHNSDITVADFWGIENMMQEIDDDKGASLAMIHSDKGAHIIRAVNEKVISKEVCC